MQRTTKEDRDHQSKNSGVPLLMMGVKAQGKSKLKLRLFHRPAMAIRSKET